MLLHKATRDSLGIELKGNIVVVDEAHNLVDAINEMHSTQLTLRQVRADPKGLDLYYRTTLQTANTKCFL